MKRAFSLLISRALLGLGLFFGLLYGVASAATDFWSTAPGLGTPDTLDDVWQSIYNGWGLSPTGDEDNDGCSNFVESVAASDPRNPSDCIKVGNMVITAGNILFTFKAEAGKKYRVMSDTSPGGSFATVVSHLEPVNGATLYVPTADSSSQVIKVSKAAGTRMFYRLEVTDLDTDGDGVSDWAERESGLNPNVAESTPGVPDGSYVQAQLALPSQVKITADAPIASEDGPTAGSFTVTRTNKLLPITVNLTAAGTATAGADYTSLPSAVTFAAGDDVETLPVMPMQNAAVEGGESVVGTVAAPVGANFTVGSNPSATVIINDSTVAAGTGLLGRYYDTSSGTYADAANFGEPGSYNFTRNASPTTTGSIVVTHANASLASVIQIGHQVRLTFTTGNLNNALYNNANYTVTAVSAQTFTVSISAAAALPASGTGICSLSYQTTPHPAIITRVDATVNNDWIYGTPNAVVIAPTNSADNYSATWETYLQPSTAGDYTFQLDADDKARVLIDLNSDGDFLDVGEQVVEHGWDTLDGISTPEVVGTFKPSAAAITLAVPSTPAQRLKMRVEHVDLTGDARCRLQWKVGTGGFANIPQANQFTHTQAMSYSFTAGNAVITPTGGHSFNVNDTVPLAFSSGVLFTPGTTPTHNKSYTITAVNGTTTYTVAITGFPITVTGATTAAGNNVIYVPSTVGLAVGMAVSGIGLPAAEFITSIGTGMITVTTGTGVTAQASTTLTATLPATGSLTGNGFVLNNSTSGTTGLYNLCYANTSFSNSPGRVGVDAAVTTGNNGIWGAGTPSVSSIQPDTFSVRWSGQMQPQFSEDYTISVTADDGCSLWINGQLQTLKMLPSANTGVGSYTYDATNGNVLVTYPTAVVPAGSFIVGETVRLDPSSSNLSHAPTASPTYDYDPTNGDVVVDYTNLTNSLPNPGATRLAGTYAVGDTVELDPTSGGISPLGNLPYVITAADSVNNKFTFNAGALTFTPTFNVASIATGAAAQITTTLNHGLATGARVKISGVTGGTFSVPINGIYTITSTGLNTFTVASNCTVAPTAGTGLVNASGNITINDSRNAQITSVHATGTGTYSYDSTTGNTVVTFSSLGLPAGTFVNGQKIVLDPTSGNIGALNSAFYTISSVTATTFTINVGTGFTTGIGNMFIVAPSNGAIAASTTTAFMVNLATNGVGTGNGKYADNSTGTINVDLINKPLKEWSSNGNERFVRIPMIGGVRYDIQLDYYESTSAAKCVLSWFSASQPKQVIPQERLYPSGSTVAPPAYVAPTEATALAGGVFSFPIAISNGGTPTFSGLPAWLTYSGGTLSGTPPAGAAGNYQILVNIANPYTSSTSLLNLHVDENAATVAREYWSGIAGATVASIPTNTNPTGSANLTSLAAPTDFGDNYGARVRGYISAPTTGNYYFWIAASNSAELWISNDSEPVNIFKRASVVTGSATPQTWNGETNQKSPWLALEQGKKYYFEVLHKAGVGSGDNLAIGWAKPGEATAVPSQVVPGFVLSPYAAPVAGPTSGTLYLSTMLAQNGALTNGVGTSTMRLSPDENTAYMRRSYSNLSGGNTVTSEHIHTDPYLTKPSTIVYDIDTPATPGDGKITDTGDPNYTGTDPQVATYKWTITPVGTLSKADIIEIIKQGKVYINLHTVAYPNGEIRGNYTLANGTRTFSPPPAPPSWTDDSSTANGAARFLGQASFGANIADITALQGLTATSPSPAMAGVPSSRYNTWIDNQFGIAPTQHLPETLAREIADVFGSFDVKISFNTWWKTALTGPDQLRQRIAYALSQIHVVSGQGPLEDNSRALSYFYDKLAANAFGNFSDTLRDTTLTPSMGRYLDMLGNDKPDLSLGRSPNENYAREIKQLFSIGLYRMWPDGTLMLTSQDSPIDTYTQREIVGLAHVFTGWYYGYDGVDRTSFSAAADWTRQMRVVPARHFTGQKRLLNNEVLPGLSSVAGVPLDPYANHLSTQFNEQAYKDLPTQELNAAHDMLLNHPNTGPFICRQLIQRLVTSNPSRDYLYRVVQKFNDNGSGVRGDMKAVIKAILLDYEARSTDLLTIPAYGKQREPIQRITNAARALRTANVGGNYSQTGLLNTSGAPYITISTGTTPHLLTSGNSVFLEFTDTTGDPTKPAPPTGTYTVLSNPTPTSTTYAIAAPGWMTGTYNQVGTTITITMSGHNLPGDNANVFPSAQTLPGANKGQAYFDFTSGALDNTTIDRTARTVATTTAYDIPSGVGNTRTLPSVDGNYSGTTFTITALDSATRSGNVMISRFSGSYSCTGRAGTITIDTNYGGAGTFGTMADHGLLAGDPVFLNFTNSRDTTVGGTPTSTENDLTYTIGGVPDANTFTVQARDAANAAMNSDNQVVVFPLKAQPLIRAGTINARPSTYTMDNTDTDLQQTPLNSPTVFNYFLPEYKFAGTLASQGITTPEFQLTSETTVIRQANFIYSGIFNPSSTTGISSFKSGTNALVLDLSPWIGTTSANLGLGAPTNTTVPWTHNQNLSTLIDQFSTLLSAGQLSTATKNVIKNFVMTPIASIGTSATACLVTTTVPHKLVTGDTVLISGVTGGTFGGTAGALNNTTTTRVVTVTGLTDGTSTTFTIPLACTVVPTSYTNAHVSVIPYNQGAATDVTNRRDRLRTILHLILTSPDHTIQR